MLQLRRQDLLSKQLVDEQRKRAEFEKDMNEGKALVDARYNEAVRDLQENFQIWKDYLHNPTAAPQTPSPAKPTATPGAAPTAASVHTTAPAPAPTALPTTPTQSK